MFFFPPFCVPIILRREYWKNYCVVVSSDCYVGEGIFQLEREPCKNATWFLVLGPLVVYSLSIQSLRLWKQEELNNGHCVLWGTELFLHLFSLPSTHGEHVSSYNQKRKSEWQNLCDIYTQLGSQITPKFQIPTSSHLFIMHFVNKWTCFYLLHVSDGIFSDLL